MAGGAATTSPRGKARKRTAGGGAAATARSRNFTPGGCVGALKATANHWAAYRGSRTGDMKRRTGAALLAAFVTASPSKDHELARTRTADNVNKKIKNMRSRDMDTFTGGVHWNEHGAE